MPASVKRAMIKTQVISFPSRKKRLNGVHNGISIIYTPHLGKMVLICSAVCPIAGFVDLREQNESLIFG